MLRQIIVSLGAHMLVLALRRKGCSQQRSQGDLCLNVSGVSLWLLEDVNTAIIMNIITDSTPTLALTPAVNASDPRSSGSGVT